MRLIKNLSTFIRIKTAEKIPNGLYEVVARDENNNRLICSYANGTHWITYEEMMTSFITATKEEIDAYIIGLKDYLHLYN